MPIPKRWIPILSLLTAGFLFWLVKPPPSPIVAWNLPPQHDAQIHLLPTETGAVEEIERTESPPVALERQAQSHEPELGAIGQVVFRPGTLKPVGEPYTKTVVVSRMKHEDVEWIKENFGGDENIRPAIYVVDDPKAELHPPKNKGHEVMVYLSYIVDHYDNLSDVNVFMHSHRTSWHGNDVLDNDAVQMISRLSAERVQREGYMNLRCHWDPGCPDWMHPGAVEEDVNKQEESMLARTWLELFPLDEIPEVLAQPCCGQFAISRDTIRSQPLARYVFYRDWLLRTDFSDYISGRVWEYIWQFVFTGKNVLCPKEHVCYCDGYGVCFGGGEEYNTFYARREKRIDLEERFQIWLAQNGTLIEEFEPPYIGPGAEMYGEIQALLAWEDKKKQQAKERGDVAMNRAKEAGRDWSDGDGF